MINSKPELGLFICHQIWHFRQKYFKRCFQLSASLHRVSFHNSCFLPILYHSFNIVFAVSSGFSINKFKKWWVRYLIFSVNLTIRNLILSMSGLENGEIFNLKLPLRPHPSPLFISRTTYAWQEQAKNTHPFFFYTKV